MYKQKNEIRKTFNADIKIIWSFYNALLCIENMSFFCVNWNALLCEILKGFRQQNLFFYSIQFKLIPKNIFN